MWLCEYNAQGGKLACPKGFVLLANNSVISVFLHRAA